MGENTCTHSIWKGYWGLLPGVSGVIGVSGLITALYRFMATIIQHSKTGPTIAPCKPKQYIPPAIARPVKYGCPPLKIVKYVHYFHLGIVKCNHQRRQCRAIVYEVCFPQIDSVHKSHSCMHYKPSLSGIEQDYWRIFDR